MLSIYLASYEDFPKSKNLAESKNSSSQKTVRVEKKYQSRKKKYQSRKKKIPEFGKKIPESKKDRVEKRLESKKD